MRMSGNTLSVGFVSEKASRIFGNFLAGTWRDPSSPPCKVHRSTDNPLTPLSVTDSWHVCGGFILEREADTGTGGLWCILVWCSSDPKGRGV